MRKLILLPTIALLIGFLALFLAKSNVEAPAPTNEIKGNLIQIISPKVNEVVSSPILVSGIARGFWFFEATAPVVLVNWDGLIIGEGYIEVTPPANWMTEDFVPFQGILKFDSALYEDKDLPEFMKKGTVILQKSNPSGLPEHDDAREVSVVFSSLRN